MYTVHGILFSDGAWQTAEPRFSFYREVLQASVRDENPFQGMRPPQ